MALTAVRPGRDDLLSFPVEQLHELHHAAGDVLASPRARADRGFRRVAPLRDGRRVLDPGGARRTVAGAPPQKAGDLSPDRGHEIAVEPDDLLGGLPRDLPAISRQRRARTVL